MGVEFRPLVKPTFNYSPEAEDIFRRQVEGYLLLLSAGVTEAIEARSASASLASKRERFLSPSIGIATYSGP